MRDSAKKPDPKPAAVKFTVADAGGKTLEFTDLGKFPHRTVDFESIGDGRGFHGLRQFDGVPVWELLAGLATGQEPDKVVLVTATDGYQGLFSFGEIFLAPLGERAPISLQSVTC